MLSNIAFYILVGFFAQIIDGSLGMAYGVSSNALLISLGVPLAAASASVHTSEIFTTLVSGLSHIKFGNIDFSLVKKLALPGVVGGILGAYCISSVDGVLIKPIIACYLIVMGVRILIKAFQKEKVSETKELKTLPLSVLGLTGGFCDAAGGGGWGPIVTTTLLSQGVLPRKTIGSVNLSEFFVTLAESFTFVFTIGLIHWKVIVGLLIGGVIAAPLGAFFTQRIPVKPMMILVGCLIIILNVRVLCLAWNIF